MTPARRWCRLEEATLVISGELDEAGSASFAAEIAALPPLPPLLRLDLSGLELADATAAVAAVNAVRRLAGGRRLVLIAAPQLLAHNLYRIGGLEDGRLRLEATREDEPYG